jgi:hypothetical protein
MTCLTFTASKLENLCSIDVSNDCEDI